MRHDHCFRATFISKASELVRGRRPGQRRNHPSIAPLCDNSHTQIQDNWPAAGRRKIKLSSCWREKTKEQTFQFRLVPHHFQATVKVQQLTQWASCKANKLLCQNSRCLPRKHRLPRAQQVRITAGLYRRAFDPTEPTHNPSSLLWDTSPASQE